MRFFTSGWRDETATQGLARVDRDVLSLNPKPTVVIVQYGMYDAGLKAFEQPRLNGEARHGADETLWLYAQSNVLIHHLIGNGRILPDEQWRAVFEGAGCRVESIRPVEYLGYNAYLFQL